MCQKLFASLMGAPTKADTIRADAQQKAAAEAAKPARVADEAREDGGAEVLDEAGSGITTSTTDVAVKSTKKNARKGVPGLGL